MIFQSMDFLVFLLVVLSVYWTLPHRAQNLFLLAASFFFYGYVHPWFLAIFLATTTVDYAVAIGMERLPRRKRALLIISLVSNLGCLCAFKYFDFFVSSLNAIAGHVGLSGSMSTLSLLAPVGISFYVFQGIGYVIDVHRGELRARRDFVCFALYLCFFPHMVAGPIQRAGGLLPQVESRRYFSVGAAQEGLFLIVWGLFKKVVIADNVALIVDKVFALTELSVPLLGIGALAFGAQIYADFSAYTDIARGVAKWMGFELAQNFREPYLAASPREFWKRWHISLSEWIRDYVYLPLGGSRVGPIRRVINVLLTFSLFGLWHGASWNYVLWGLYHGVLVLLYRWLRWEGKQASSLWTHLARVFVMFVLVHLGWILFRSRDLSVLFASLVWTTSGEQWEAARYLFALVLVYSLPLWIQSAHTAVGKVRHPMLIYSESGRIAVETLLGLFLVVGILAFSAGVTSDFIYFQF